MAFHPHGPVPVFPIAKWKREWRQGYRKREGPEPLWKLNVGLAQFWGLTLDDWLVGIGATFKNDRLALGRWLS